MLHKQIIIATHLGSGGSMLLDMITANRRIAKLNRSPGQVFAEPPTVFRFQTETKEHYPLAKMFVDEVVYNYEVLSPSLYSICDFVFLIREPEGAISSIVEKQQYTPEAALRYYCFRLRRLSEMAKKTARKLVITWDELIDKSCFPGLKKFIGLKELTSMYRPETINHLDRTIVTKGRLCYERHLQFMRALCSSPVLIT